MPVSEEEHKPLHSPNWRPGESCPHLQFLRPLLMLPILVWHLAAMPLCRHHSCAPSRLSWWSEVGGILTSSFNCKSQKESKAKGTGFASVNDTKAGRKDNVLKEWKQEVQIRSRVSADSSNKYQMHCYAPERVKVKYKSWSPVPLSRGPPRLG